MSGWKYGESLVEPICVCSFKNTFSAGQLIEFGDPALPVINCIEKPYTCQLVHSRMVSLFFVNKFLMALVTVMEVSPGTQFPWLPHEMQKVKSLLLSFEQHEEALLDWIHQHVDA